MEDLAHISPEDGRFLAKVGKLGKRALKFLFPPTQDAYQSKAEILNKKNKFSAATNIARIQRERILVDLAEQPGPAFVRPRDIYSRLNQPDQQN